MIRSQMVTVVATFAVVQCGCATAQRGSIVKDQPAYRSRAMESLRAAIRYGHNPVVRAEAVEAMEMAASRETLPWIRAALIDPHPAVRFAACVAVGRVRDTVSLRAVRNCADDNNCSVRAAAMFALHRFGDQSRSGQLPSYLLGGNDITCRRNAALVLGLLDEPSAIKALARAMKRVTSKAPVALRLAEQLIDQGARMPLDEGLQLELDHLVEIFSTEDALEGLSSLGKKKPHFTGH